MSGYADSIIVIRYDYTEKILLKTQIAEMENGRLATPTRDHDPSIELQKRFDADV